MTERVKFTHITRTIDPKSRIHYLDAIDENGIHWMSEMSPHKEPWLVYTRQWGKNHQQPYNYD